MTKKILFISILIMINIFSLAQSTVYHKFPVNNAVWRVKSFGLYSPCLDYQYTITGDTSIFGLIYHKLQNSGGSFWIDPSQYCHFDSLIGTYSKYSGAFREDTILKRIFYIPYYATTERLLYNFNLNIGDSINNTFNYDSINTNYNSYVMTVDSVMVGNEYRRRLGIGNSMAFPNYVYLIEGIGSTYGLIEPIAPHFEWGSELLCFKENNVPLYPDTNYNCDLVLNIQNYFEKMPVLSIFPNPFNTTTEILFDRQYKTIDIEIFNTIGKLMEKLKYSDCRKIKVDIITLTDGLYFARLTLNNNFTTIKKLVIKR